MLVMMLHTQTKHRLNAAVIRYIYIDLYTQIYMYIYLYTHAYIYILYFPYVYLSLHVPIGRAAAASWVPLRAPCWRRGVQQQNWHVDHENKQRLNLRYWISYDLYI